MNNEQEQFWQGQFGDDYTARNINLVENNYQMFEKIFSNEFAGDKYDINSIIEFGAGSGQNILALQRIFPDADYRAVEINSSAIKVLINEIKVETVFQSILDYSLSNKYDLVLSKGLLIHMHPDDIENAFDIIYNASNKYILLCEYYSPVRREILYRGQHNKLWTFDFILPMVNRGCDLIDYGFQSKYDKYQQDDLTWALFKK